MIIDLDLSKYDQFSQRLKKQKPNDVDRLRKYSDRFQITWDDI